MHVKALKGHTASLPPPRPALPLLEEEGRGGGTGKEGQEGGRRGRSVPGISVEGCGVPGAGVETWVVVVRPLSGDPGREGSSPLMCAYSFTCRQPR